MRHFMIKVTTSYSLCAWCISERQSRDFSHFIQGTGQSVYVYAYSRAFILKYGGLAVLTRVSSLSKDRNIAIRIAACSCITSILRSLPPGSHRRLSNTTIQILNAVLSDTTESAEYRIKACHILGKTFYLLIYSWKLNFIRPPSCRRQ